MTAPFMTIPFEAMDALQLQRRRPHKNSKPSGRNPVV